MFGLRPNGWTAGQLVGWTAIPELHESERRRNPTAIASTFLRFSTDSGSGENGFSSVHRQTGADLDPFPVCFEGYPRYPVSQCDVLYLLIDFWDAFADISYRGCDVLYPKTLKKGQ